MTLKELNEILSQEHPFQTVWQCTSELFFAILSNGLIVAIDRPVITSDVVTITNIKTLDKFFGILVDRKFVMKMIKTQEELENEKQCLSISQK